MRMQPQNDYAKETENISYPETLAEAYNLTIYWEGNKKIWNNNDNNDKGRGGNSVNFYNSERKGHGNNDRHYKKGNGNNNRDRNKNDEASERLCHGEACYGELSNSDCTAPNKGKNRGTSNTNINNNSNENES